MIKRALPILRLAAILGASLLAQSSLVLVVRASIAIHSEIADADRVCTSSVEERICVNTSKLNEKEEDEEEPLDENSSNIRYYEHSYWCRRMPTWNSGETDEGLRHHCQRVMGYKPDLEALMEENGEFHPMIHNYQDLPALERPLIHQLAVCLENHIINATSTTKTASNDNTTPIRKHNIAKLFRREDGLPMAAIVEDALSEQEAEGVLGLASCLRKHAPMNFEKRRFENTYQGSGNDVTFLSGFLQVLLPGVASSIHQTAHLVWTAAKWGEYPEELEPIDAYHAKNQEDNYVSKYSNRWWPDPIQECGIRTTEHLSYDRWNGLGFHEDHGSDYTVLVALSDPSDYEGGEFSICPEDDETNGDCPDKISIKLQKRSAVVFLSEFSHGVEDIHSLGRVMFANELWRYGDCPVLSKRPTDEEHVLGIQEYDDKDEV